jgi:hypothetical protein
MEDIMAKNIATLFVIVSAIFFACIFSAGHTTTRVVCVLVWILLGCVGVSMRVYHSIMFYGHWHTPKNNIKGDVESIRVQILEGPRQFIHAIWEVFTEKEAGNLIFGFYNIFSGKKLRAMHRGNVLH